MLFGGFTMERKRQTFSVISFCARTI
uniref:Uncharacterized protein n=1 Tax=Ralstonia solanacearum TaxID=305 RepID=A0A0S4TQV3_RALSL|nr:protein of unknown function [Ralstonia solanacearum]